MPFLHHTRRYTAIRALVLSLLGDHPRFLSRRRMARFLRSLADELDQPCPPRRINTAQPLGTGLRWNGRDLLIGRSLWDGIGKPRRVSFEFVGSVTRIRGDPDGDYTVRYGGNTVAKIGCIRVWHIGQWAEGWRPGRIEGRSIVFEIEATEA